MTQDNIAKLYEKANGWSPAQYKTTMEELERFVKLVRSDECEACAKVVDGMADDMVREMEPSTAIAYVRSKAAVIRARGETK